MVKAANLKATGATASEEREEYYKRKGKLPASKHLCYCPVEGCSSASLRKLSNHLAQFHKLPPKECSKYLGLKRKFATPGDIERRARKVTVLRKSPKIETYFKSITCPEPYTKAGYRLAPLRSMILHQEGRFKRLALPVRVN